MKANVLGYGALLTVFLAFGLLVGCGSREGNARGQSDQGSSKVAVQAPERITKVRVVTVQPALIRDVLLLPGALMSWQDVRVSATMSGNLEWIGPNEGQAVARGELIAKINVSALKAALEQAEAGFKMAEDLYQRRQTLFQKTIISQEVLDQARTERTVAEGKLHQIRVQYEEGFVKAPIGGRVNKRYVDQGEFVGPGTAMFDLVDNSQMKIEVSVPELDVHYLSVGQKALVRVDAFPDRILEGRVLFVAYAADPATKTFRVTLAIENRKQDIRAGMIARVGLLRREVPDALVAPLSALVDRNGERLIFVEENGVAHARNIAIGVIEQDRVQVTEGLKAGEKLIVAGQSGLEEGVKVQVQ
jgi:membrane fusion protein (multidrug efflux system)